jgi:hypothetical protein
VLGVDELVLIETNWGRLCSILRWLNWKKDNFKAIFSSTWRVSGDSYYALVGAHNDANKMSTIFKVDLY